tara:strand:+ start:435 stop:1835 length:1401 start_codon:yes stop_codon:yes gene_type:complete
MGGTMKFTIQIKCGDDSSAPLLVAEIERKGPLKAGSLGLTLAESKGLLANVQKELVESQVQRFIQDQRFCSECGSLRTIKDYHNVRFKSLFGGVDLRVPRLNGCPFKKQKVLATTVKINGLNNWVSPEFEFIQSQLAATIPYARSAELLGLLLPADAGNAASTIRRRAIRIGERLDAELHEHDGATDKAESPAHRGRIAAVGLDSGYLYDCRPNSIGSFEVVVGRIINKGRDSRSLGFVRAIESNQVAGHRLRQKFSEQGKVANGVSVFTDGDPGLRRLLLTALPKARHILDWYHLTRRLTVLKTILLGKEAIKHFPAEYHDPLKKHLESLKWRLWHGRLGGAINRIKAILFSLRLPTISCKRPAIRMRRRIKELLRYLQNNQDSLANYGRRYRSGQRISTAFVESAVNQLIDKRMSKSQQMRWSPLGAHALLQVRAELVDGRLHAAFDRWYPGFAGEGLIFQTSR